MLPPLPTSISELEYYQNDLEFRQFAQEHWAALYPMCDNPVRVEENDERLRVVMFDTYFIDRGTNYEFIREGHFAEGGKEVELINRYKLFNAAHPVDVTWVFKSCQSFEKRFEFALMEELGDDVFPFVARSIENRRDVWDFTLSLVLDEILRLRVLKDIDSQVLSALKLDDESILLTQHYFGWASSDQVCAVHRNIEVFRRFEYASPALRRLLVLAITDKLIDGDGDVVGQLWALVRRQGVSRAALKKFMALNQMELDAIRERFCIRESFIGLIQTIKFVHWVPVKLSGNGLRIMIDSVGNFGGFQSNFDFTIVDNQDRTYFLPFLRMLAREIARREVVGELDELEREQRLVSDWIVDSIPGQDFPDKQVLVIDRQQEKAGWPWLMKRQEEWHQELMGMEQVEEFANEWDHPSPDATRNYSWESLLKSYQDGDFSVEALTDAQSLWKEGKRMRHCVGTYANICYQGKCRIFSVKDVATGNPLATVELVNAYKGLRWQLGQVAGPLNAKVTPEIEEVGRKILNRYVEVVGKISNNSGY